MIEPNTRLQERGADAGKALKGSVEIALPDVPGALDGWIGVGGARIDGSNVDYTLTNTVETRIRPRQPYDDGPVPVLVTPRLAAAADSARRCSHCRSQASGSRYESSGPFGGSLASMVRRWSVTATRWRQSSIWRGPVRRA